MNWVKIQNNLPDSPKVIQLARCMQVSEAYALGVAVRWLCWLDKHTEDGKTGLLVQEVAKSICGHTDAVKALQGIGWADVDEDGTVYAVNFDKYNSPTAKAKTLAAARQKKSRLNKKSQQQHNKN